MAETIRERIVVGPVCEDTLLPPPSPEAPHPQHTNNKEAKRQEWRSNRACVYVYVCVYGGGGVAGGSVAVKTVPTETKTL